MKTKLKSILAIALCAVGLAAFAAETVGVQLWEGGPYFATCNVGGTVPGDYGELYTFSDDKAKSAAESLGAGWHLPTKAELDALISNCNYAWETSKDSTGADINGCRLTGKGNYSSNSIFLPAAGYFSSYKLSVGKEGSYWSSEEHPAGGRYWCFNFTFGSSGAPRTGGQSSNFGMSVRAVKDPPKGGEDNPWEVGSPTAADVKAWTNGTGKLVVEGTGAMQDFEEDAAAPWYSERATITTVKIGSGVTRIGSFAFYNCKTMASVTIPSSVTSTGVRAFSYCTGVAELRIDSIESWCKVSIDGDRAVSGPFAASTVSEKKLYVGGADVPTTALVIPDGIKKVNEYAFAHFGMLTSVTIPSSVTSIGNNAFDSCSGLTSVTISEGVTNIGDAAFQKCSGLTSVTIPSSVTSIDNSAFSECSGLTSVTMLEGLPSIAPSMFAACSNLTSVTIPASVTNIGYQAFQLCTGLTSVTIPSSVTSIGRSAFDRCSGLTRVTIPSSVENIGNQAFIECSGLTSVTIPASVTNIGLGAFSSCSALKYVVEMREQPPTAGTRIFGHEKSPSFKGKTIYVSPTSVGDYKAKDGWSTYKDFIKSWLPTVEYLDWDDEKKEMCSVTCMAYDVVTADTATFEAGRTYMVTNDVINASDPLGITVEGTEANPTRLILCNGAKLTVTGQSAAETAGLNVSNGTAIVICGQKGGTGVLEATGGSGAAGIGGNAGQAAGTVTIYGGSVTALGKNGAAGIGGGMNKTDTGTVTFGAKFSVVTGETATVTAPIAQGDYVNDHSAKYAHIEPLVVAQFVKGGEVVAEFATAEEAVAALDDAQYADIDEFRIGLAADTVFDFGGRTNRVVILNVGNVENTLKNVLLDCAGDCAVTGMVGTVVFGDGVRIEKSALDFKQGWVNLIIKGGLYKNEPIGYCEGGYLSARRYDENEHLNGLYAVLPAAEIAVEDRKEHTSTRYATLQDAFNLIGENKEVTLRLVSNLELGTAVTKLEGNKVIHLLPSEAGANTITRVGAEPVIEIGRGAKLEISNVIFDGANVTSEKPMIEVAGKTGTNFGWLIAGDGFVVSNAVGGAVHVGSGGKFELNGVAKIIDNTTGGKPKNVIIEDKQAIVLVNGGAVTDGNYAQIGVWSDNDKFMIPGGQFGAVDLSYEYATYFSDGDISVAKPWVGFINDRDGTLHHAAGAKIAAAPKAGEGKKTYKRWVGGEYKVTLEEGDYLISREKSIVSVSPELVWTARQDAPAAEPAPAVLDWTDTTLTLAVSNGCDYALVTDGMAETNWVSMVGTDNTYAFARPAGTDYLCLRRYSITPSNIVSAATAYSVRVAAGTEGDPWLVGEGIAAWTNGTAFVIGGTGTVPDLSKLASKVTVDALTIADATVTGAESEAFKGFSNVSLTLPDGWQGELPDEGGNWYGATGVTLKAVPLAVKNVTFQQRYPWNGLVDVGFTLTGPAGETNVVVTAYTNGTVKIADFTAAVTIPADGVLATNLVWNAAAASLAANFKSDDVTVEVAFAGGLPAAPSAPAISAKSAAGTVDLTVGDRVAKDKETLVVDPAWDETDPMLAKVLIDGEDEPRTYTCASNDLWQTASLEPGRYEAVLMTACSSYLAGFWKVGDDWTVFDSSNITADVTFVAGKTYLFFGTNTADGATLKVEDGAKFFYDEGASAGLLGGQLEAPRRYRKEVVEGDLYRIVEAIKGCEDNPWDIGEGVTAYTNGTELVIGGEGTVADLSEISDEVKGEVESLTIATNGVTGVASEAFEGVGENGMVALTLPDGWEGELPDDDGNWYGARNVSLTAYPLAVKNVTFQQRYPWNGKVDIGFGVTGPEGETNVVVTVRDGANKVANFTAAVTIPADGVLATNLVWDATTAGLAANFKSDDVMVEVKIDESDIAAKSAAGTVDLRTAVALAEGETTVSNVTWSATLWGELDEEFVTAIGWTNLTTGATGVFSNLAGVVGEAAEDADLPQKDGDYRLTHSTGDLTSFVKFTVSGYPLGSEGNPWTVGPSDNPDGTVAWTDGNGNVYFKPARSTVSREGLETVTNAMGGASFPAKLIAADGSETNDLVMAVGASGTVYDTIADALYADETSYALFDVNGYLVSYDGGAGAVGAMATDMFVPGVPTNLTANAYMIVGYAFTGWSTDGVNKAYDDCAAGVDFVQPGETLSLTALWEQVAAVPASYDDLTNMLANATRPVTITLDEDIEIPVGGKIVVPAGKDVTFVGTGKFDVSGIVPQFGVPVVVGEGLAEGDLDRFDADGVSKPVFEDGKVGLIARGESADFPWVVDEENGVTAWVDPALTNLAAVVIDNGMPTAMNEIDLVALTNNLATYGYEPAKTPLNALLKVEDGGETVYLKPVEWITEQGNAYKTLEAALAAGETVVVPDFVTEEIPEEIAETGTGADGKTYTAVVENVPAEGGEPQVRAVRAEGLIDLATNLEKNVTLVVETVEEACVPTQAAEKLAAANTNGVADVIGYAADYVDLSLYFNEDQQSEIGETIAIHVPWTINPRQAYRISRIHDGVAKQLPVGAENAADGEYVEILADGFVIHAKKFSLYAIGEITLQPRYGIVIGNGGKTLGEPDPSSLATNFTVNVQGLDIEPGDIGGYCVRAKGEAAGDYAINFVCTRKPQDFDGEIVVFPGTFTIVMGGKLPAEGTVTYPKAAKGSEFLKPNANATWMAKPDACSVFANWAAAEGASETVANLLAAAGDKVFKTTLTLKIPAGAKVRPTDIVATWKRIDEDVPAGQAAVMLRCDPTMGKVTGSKLYKLNAKTGSVRVSINATANKDYVFAGWYEDPGFSQPAEFFTGTGASAKPKDYRTASQSITVTANTYLFARFVEKTTKADPITHLRFLGAGYCGADASEFAETETWYQGVALPTNCTVAFGSASLPTVKVTGLPAGVKIDKYSRCFTGVPTACSTAKKPFFTVTVTVKNKSGANDVLVKNVYVEPLPAWAVGNYDGYHIESGVTNGTLTATVGKTGKVSGKTKGGLAATKFSAKGFANVELVDGWLCYVANVTVSYKDPLLKKTVGQDDTLYLMENPETGLGMLGGGDEFGSGCVGVQRAWERKDLGMPAFPTGKSALTREAPMGIGLKFKFGAKGKVTVSGVVPGDDLRPVKASATAQVMPVALERCGAPQRCLAQTCVYVAPKKNLADGFCEVYNLMLEAEETGRKITEVKILTPEEYSDIALTGLTFCINPRRCPR